MTGESFKRHLPKSLPLVSITTATYNCEATVARAVESVLGQDYPSIEYVVMDGASSDSTLAVVESYSDDFRKKGFSFSVESRPDGGMYEAINSAMDRCHGDLVGNVNGDDCLEPDAARTMAAAYLEVGFDVAYADLNVHTGKGSFVKRARRMSPWPTSRKWNHPTMFLANGARALRYRTDGNPYADFDLFLRALDMGFDSLALPFLVSNFNFGGMSTKGDWKAVAERLTWKNQIFVDNHCPPMTFVEGFLIELAKGFAA